MIQVFKLIEKHVRTVLILLHLTRFLTFTTLVFGDTRLNYTKVFSEPISKRIMENWNSIYHITLFQETLLMRLQSVWIVIICTVGGFSKSHKAFPRRPFMLVNGFTLSYVKIEDVKMIKLSNLWWLRCLCVVFSSKEMVLLKHLCFLIMWL